MGTEEAYGRPAPEPAPPGSIVVGHDGSSGADFALAMALDVAAELSLPLTVVRAWSIATAPRPAEWKFGYVPAFEEFSRAVNDELVRDTGKIVEKSPEVLITYCPVCAPPVKSLIAISHDARILVVGTRGRGGLKGMLLGSVSEQCVRHAACSVLVARPRP